MLLNDSPLHNLTSRRTSRIGFECGFRHKLRCCKKATRKKNLWLIDWSPFWCQSPYFVDSCRSISAQVPISKWHTRILKKKYFLDLCISLTFLFPQKCKYTCISISWAWVFPGRGVNLRLSKVWGVVDGTSNLHGNIYSELLCHICHMCFLGNRWICDSVFPGKGLNLEVGWI